MSPNLPTELIFSPESAFLPDFPMSNVIFSHSVKKKKKKRCLSLLGLLTSPTKNIPF